MVELAKLLVHRHSTLVISIPIITSPSTAAAVTRYTDSLAQTPRVNLLRLHNDDDDQSVPGAIFSVIQNQKPQVREAVSAQLAGSGEFTPAARLTGFVLDMFCTSMLDVAEEFGVPSYLFFPSGAAFLGFMFHIQTLHDEEGFDAAAAAESTEAELVFPGLVRPLPGKVLPSGLLHEELAAASYRMARDFRKSKGILVNTVKELESYAVDSLSRTENPKVYPVGPILNLKPESSSESSGSEEDEVVRWLDQQSESSVAFLCFGSMGGFCAEQVKEIACALEGSGHRFLWSLRRLEGGPALTPKTTDYGDVREVLPEGFVDRTTEVGRVIGWAPPSTIHQVRLIQTDNGLEFQSAGLLKYYEDNGILLQTSCINTPQQNRTAERKHRHLLETTRALRFHSGLPVHFWGNCVLTTMYLSNRLPSKLLGNWTPFEVLLGRIPPYQHLRNFGCLVYMKDTSPGLDKFVERGRPDIFVGYPASQKGYTVYEFQSRKVVTSRDVHFFADNFPYRKRQLASSTRRLPRLVPSPTTLLLPMTRLSSSLGL
ncbi:unnamed protein product [Linum tenue]|uniref:Integrase catalytic domain-containing protein n=1 Tax=Linum tenue TaxID=586396 RepID=A0AAV0QBK0_9ROSI|nr:unnamed protein product [Linum tenue]